MSITVEAPATVHSPAGSGRAGIDPAEPEASPGTSPHAVAAATIALSALTAHPGNVRADVAVSAEFLASVKTEGIRVPLLITTTDETGVFRIIDGHRRFAAAQKAGLAAVPYTFDAARADDLAGQYLDMVITSRHKTPLTVFEEASALFAAEQAGASKTRLSKAYGKREKVAAALKAATLPQAAREAAAEADYPWTIDELAALQEFGDDEEATARLISAAESDDFGYQVERERLEREEERQRATLRAEVEAAGVRFSDEEPPGALRLNRVPTPDGYGVSTEEHAACPGHAATFARYSAEPQVVYLCAAPHEHIGTTGQNPATTPTPADAARAQAEDTAAKTAARRLVIRGNKDWKAAEANRRNWLKALLSRATLTKEHADTLARFTAATYLAAPGPIMSGTGSQPVRDLQYQLLSLDKAPADWTKHAAAISGRRLPLLTFAPIAAAYEKAMTDKQWRTDTDHWIRAERRHAQTWLGFCQNLGHSLSPIERALLADQTYSPDDPAPALTDQDEDDRAQDNQGDDEPGEQVEDDSEPADALTT